MRKWLIGLGAIVGLIVGAFALSPWPSVWVIRAIFDKGASDASAKLEKHVPAGIAMTTLRYDPGDPDAVLDILRPRTVAAGRPTIVWIHGGGFVSGRRGDLSNYLKVLAGRGFTVVNVDYMIAPEATYPTPIRQVSRALAFLTREAPRLGIDANRLVLAGDSAGAQIAAQTAAIVTDPGYARRVGVPPGAQPGQIAGALLLCGVYDPAQMGDGWFVRTTTWAYSGKRDWRDVPGFATMAVTPNVTARFPPAFISAGNADPLGPQSVALAAALKEAGVQVTELFFPADHQPPLRHEYQFDLDTRDGQLALERSVAWLERL